MNPIKIEKKFHSKIQEESLTWECILKNEIKIYKKFSFTFNKTLSYNFNSMLILRIQKKSSFYW